MPPYPQPQSKGLAITSMVLGIISVSCLGLVIKSLVDFSRNMPPGTISVAWLGFITGLPAIITGHIAHSRARKAPEQYGGARFAKAGFVMGYVSVLFTLLLLAIAVPFVRAGQAAMRAECIKNLRLIEAAKEQWAFENKKTAGEPVIDDQVERSWKSSNRPICPAGGVYSYNPVGMEPTCSRGADLGHTL